MPDTQNVSPETPLIHTIRGNLPQASLRMEPAWEFGGSYIKFTERYFAEDGEIVRESCHVYSIPVHLQAPTV